MKMKESKMASSISDQAYESILEEIVAGTIPAGTAISEHSLAKQLNISRTPVREAMRRLKHEGVVEQFPRCGTVVRYPSVDEIRELYEFREALECYAVRRAAEVATEKDIAILTDLVEENHQLAGELQETGASALKGAALKRFLEIDMAFHQHLLEMSGNRRILRSVSESRVITRIFGTPRQVHNLSIVAWVYRRHTRILQCVREGKGELASHYMAEHISASCKKMLEHYRQLEHQGIIPQINPLNVRVGLNQAKQALVKE